MPDPSQIDAGGGEQVRPKNPELWRAEAPAPGAGSLHCEAGRETPHRGRCHCDRIPLRLTQVRAALKQFIFRLLGKDPEAIVVTFATGDPELAQRMFAEIQRSRTRPASLSGETRRIPGRFDDSHLSGASQAISRLSNRSRSRCYWMRDRRYRALRRAAFLYAPTKILAYNQRLERHHLRLDHCDRVTVVCEGRAARSNLSSPEVARSLEERSVHLSI